MVDIVLRVYKMVWPNWHYKIECYIKFVSGKKLPCLSKKYKYDIEIEDGWETNTKEEVNKVIRLVQSITKNKTLALLYMKNENSVVSKVSRYILQNPETETRLVIKQED